MSTAALRIGPEYERARAIFPILPANPTYRADQPEANAEAGVEGGLPWFSWRDGYPSPALDAATSEREAKRTACHEIGHPYELLCLLRGIPVRALFGAWRGFEWAAWEADGLQPREFFADTFGAALSGEWITPLGVSEADRHRRGLPAVSPVSALAFFRSLTPAPEVTPMTLKQRIAAFWTRLRGADPKTPLTYGDFIEWAANFQGELEETYVRR